MKARALSHLAIGVLFSQNIYASIVSNDWQSNGDNLISRDTITQLEWLDLTETNGLTFDYVSNQLGVGGEFEGWRYATSTEVVELWNNFNIDLVSTPYHNTGPVNNDLIIATSFLGNILNEYSTVYSYGALGITSDTNAANQLLRLGSFNIHVTSNYYETTEQGNYWDSSRESLTTGSYLVRHVTPVPIPAAIWLFFSGIIGLAALTKRQSGNFINNY